VATFANGPRAPEDAAERHRAPGHLCEELLGGNEILLVHNVGHFAANAEAICSYEGTREMNTRIVGRAISGQSTFCPRFRCLRWRNASALIARMTYGPDCR
jgi:hypothetical protein